MCETKENQFNKFSSFIISLNIINQKCIVSCIMDLITIFRVTYALLIIKFDTQSSIVG